jgi:hypothetical protein
MRVFTSFLLTPCFLCGFAATVFAKPQLELSDPKLPLQEQRPLDRRVYILTLEGVWHQPAASGKTYYINFLFPDGSGYAHKVDDVAMFERGEVRGIIQLYQLVRHGVSEGGKFTVVVSAGKEVSEASDAAVLSNALEFTWPMGRKLTRERVRSKYAPLPPVDALPSLEEQPARPAAPGSMPVRPAPQPKGRPAAD